MSESETSEKASKEYEVEEIQGSRKKRGFDHKTRKYFYYTEYLIKWVGYKRRSWEPEENLDNCKKILDSYKKRKMKSNMGYKGNSYSSSVNNNKSRTPLKFIINRRNKNKIYNYDNKNKVDEKEDEEEDEKEEEEEKEDKDSKKDSEDETNVRTFLNNEKNNNSDNNNTTTRPNLSEDDEDKSTTLNYNTLSLPKFLKNENGSNNPSLRKANKEKEIEIEKDNHYLTMGEFIRSYNNELDYGISTNNINNENIINSNSYYNDDSLNKKTDEEIVREIEKTNSALRINLLQKKRKSNSSDISEDDDLSISINDPFIKNEIESFSFNNTCDNSNNSNNYNYLINSNINSNNANNNYQILEVKIPEKKDEPIELSCKDKEKDYMLFGKSSDKNIPENVIINCYEEILKNFLRGKTIKIEEKKN